MPRFGDNLDWENQEITTRSASKGQNHWEFPRLPFLKSHFSVDLVPDLREIPWISYSYSAPAVLVVVLDPRATITSTTSLSMNTFDPRKVQLQNLRVG